MCPTSVPHQHSSRFQINSSRRDINFIREGCSGRSRSALLFTKKDPLYTALKKLQTSERALATGSRHVSCRAAGFCFDAACQREKDVLFLLSLALPVVLAGLSFLFLGRKQSEEVSSNATVSQGETLRSCSEPINCKIHLGT